MPRRPLCYLLPLLPVLLLVHGCADPIEPVFRPIDGIYLLEGRLADTPGFSQLRLTQSRQDGRRTVEELVSDAELVSRDEGGVATTWVYAGNGIYRPPADFTAATGSQHTLRARLTDGTIFSSQAEVVPPPPVITDARVGYREEAYFDVTRDRFVPTLDLLVDLENRADERNFYQFDFISWEEETYCLTCGEGMRYRNGMCEDSTGSDATWSYFCETTCFLRAPGRTVSTVSDEFNDGTILSDVLVAAVDHVKPLGGILFEAQVFRTGGRASTYANEKRALAEGGGGLNAAVPGVLSSNLTSSDPAVRVVGFVAAVSVATERVYIDRGLDAGPSLPFVESRVPELINGPSAPPRAPCVGEGRVVAVPEGWGER